MTKSRSQNAAVGLLISLFVVVNFIIPGSESLRLKCYRCLKLECTADENFCNGVRQFVANQLPDLYYIDENNIPECPDPSDILGWRRLQESEPSVRACGALQENQATCTMGRFQVITMIGTSENVTTYGNILGCARHKLLQSTVDYVRQPDPDMPRKDRIVEVNKCAMMSFNSTAQDSIAYRHYLQLEHCSKITDMCFQQDFCIDPKVTEVKKFQDQTYGVNIPMTIFIIFAVVLGTLVCILTFLGIKYA